MSPRVAATGTVRDGTVTISFGPCKRHAQNGLTAVADGLDGLCADCRSTITASVARRNTYNGSKPLATEPPTRVPNPKGRTGEGSTIRKRDRLTRFKAELTKLTAGDIDNASPAAVREAGIAAEVGEGTAKAYHRELKRELGRTP